MQTKILFICKANVGRSQIAEGLYNQYGGGAASLAGYEARKEKYNYKPDEAILRLLKNLKGVDISSQRISYISDFSTDELDEYGKIVFLYNPETETICDEACKINGLFPYKYFLRNNTPIEIHPIKDPFGESEKAIISIISEIDELIQKL